MAPTIHTFPVKRPGFIEQAVWIGTDEDMSLQVSHQNAAGVLEVVSFQTKGENTGEICLPTSTDLTTLGPRARDILAAHLRMAVMIAGKATPGSREFNDIFIQSETNNFQTALGTTKVISTRMVSDAEVDVDWKQGNGPIYTTRFGHGEMALYSFIPQTQLYIIPGSVKIQFPSYVHNWPSTVLTQTQKDNIVAYVLGIQPWI